MIINKPTKYHTGWDGMSISNTENVMFFCGEPNQGMFESRISL